MPTTRDYYEILSVERTASGDEIKRSYRRLAMKYHPDRNPGDDAAEQTFKSCAEAYEVLSDAEKRAVYDKYGHAGLRSTPGHDFNTMNVDDIFSMFNDIFGGASGGRRARRGGVPRGYDLETEVEITFDEVLSGAEREVDFKRVDVCQTCEGTGAKPGTEPDRCQTCEGQGQVAQAGFGGMFRMVTSCPDCRGQGKVIVDKCADCRGNGRVPVRRRLDVKIPAGVHDGQAVRLAGEGEPPRPEHSPSGQGIRGDLHVVIRVAAHDRFEREGDHLLVALPVTFAQAALGGRIDLDGLDDVVTVEMPPGTQHGQMFRIQEAGLPNLKTSKRGDLVVVVQLVVPRKLSDAQRALLEQYAETEELPVGDVPGPSLWAKIKDAVIG